MGSFITLNRHRIKRYINQLFDLLTDDDFAEMNSVVNKLKTEIFKFSMLQTLDFEKISQQLGHIKFAIGHGRVVEWRQNRLRKEIAVLHDLLVAHEQHLSLQARLKLLNEDLSHNLLMILSDKTVQKEDILDNFEELQNLSSEIKSLGYETYQLYRVVMKNSAAIKPYLSVAPDVDEKGKVILRPQAEKDLKSRTGPFLSALSDLIAIIDMPPAPIKEDKREDKGKKDDKKLPKSPITIDIDEMKKQTILVESSDLMIKKGWTWDNVCRHFNLTPNELLSIWSMDELVETEDDEAVDEKKEEIKTEDDAEMKPGEKDRPESKELEEFEEKEKKVKNNNTDEENENNEKI